MSYTGDPTGTPTGEPEEFVIGFLPDQLDGGLAAILPIRPAPGCGNEYWIFGADRKIGGISWINEGANIAVRVPLDPAKTGAHSFFAEPMGSWNDIGSIDYLTRVLYFESTIGSSEQIDFDVSSEVVGSVGDSNQLSGWSLSGVQRWTTCRPHEGSTVEGELDVVLTNVAGVRTVQVLLGAIVLASGFRTGDGAIALTQVNSSGVSGAVTVAYTADVPSGCVVVKRWATTYQLAVNSTPAVSTTVTDPGVGERLSAILGPISAGSYTLTITPTSDTGTAGTSGTAPVTVAGPPGAPGAVSYVSGTIANTIVSFAASATGGATYRYYDCEILNGPTMVTVIAATRGSGAGTLQLTLPALAAGSGGERWGKLVSVSGGIESAPQKFMLLYDNAGNIVVNVPNMPTIRPHGTRPVSAGRTITLDYIYDASGELAVGAKILTRIQRFSDSSIVTSGLTTMGSPGIVKTGTLSVTAVANGFFRVSAAVQTAGGAQGVWSAWTDWIYVSSAAIAAAGNIVVTPVA